MTNNSTLTGVYLVVASLIVKLLAHYNIVVPDTDVTTILTNLVILYGSIHQAYQHVVTGGSLRIGGRTV